MKTLITEKNISLIAGIIKKRIDNNAISLQNTYPHAIKINKIAESFNIKTRKIEQSIVDIFTEQIIEVDKTFSFEPNNCKYIRVHNNIDVHS